MDRRLYMQLIYRYNTGQDDWRYTLINAYKKVDNPQRWNPCPNCDLIPKIWEFNNGRATGCGCGENEYTHFSIYAESVMSVITNSDTGKDATNYIIEDLQNNWNRWVLTGEETFLHAGTRDDNKW